VFFIFIYYIFFVSFDNQNPVRRASARSPTIIISSGQVFGSCFGLGATGGVTASFLAEVKSTHSLCSVSSTVISPFSIILCGFIGYIRSPIGSHTGA
jgi:hypothetical protein